VEQLSAVARRRWLRRQQAVGHPLRQLLSEPRRAIRLCEVVVHARSHAAVDVRLQGAGCEGDHRHGPSGGVGQGSDAPACLVPVHDRHLAVHQHAVEWLARDSLNRGGAVVHQRSAGEAEPAQELQHQLLVHGVVLGDQDIR
jgi:hypothetical protein